MLAPRPRVVVKPELRGLFVWLRFVVESVVATLGPSKHPAVREASSTGLEQHHTLGSTRFRNAGSGMSPW